MESEIAIIALFILSFGFSFFLSGMEKGLLSLSHLRIRKLRREGQKSAIILETFLNDPEDLLNTILIGNTLANLAAFGTIAILIHSVISESIWLFLTLFFLAVFLFYTICELLPKMLFQKFPNRLCLFCAKPFQGVHFILSPINLVLSGLSTLLQKLTGDPVFTGHLFENKEEFHLLMQESADQLTPEERIMIGKVLQAGNLTLRQIMTPIESVLGISKSTPIREVLRLARQQDVTRVPVRKSDDRNSPIIGILSLKKILFNSVLDPDRPSGDFRQSYMNLKHSLRPEIALKKMQKKGHHLAVVVDDEGHQVGVVHLSAILKVLFGEMEL
jgi:putative hemolysin